MPQAKAGAEGWREATERFVEGQVDFTGALGDYRLEAAGLEAGLTHDGRPRHDLSLARSGPGGAELRKERD